MKAGVFTQEMKTKAEQLLKQRNQLEEDLEAASINYVEVKEENKTTEAEVHAKLLNQTDFEWHPDSDEDDHGTLPSVDANLASEASCNDPESEALLSQEPKSEIDTSKLPQSTAVKPARIGSRYKNTHV